MVQHLILCLLLAMLLLLSRLAYAECDCLWRGSFSDVQAETDLVVSGTVVARAGNSIDLEVTQHLRGQVPQETIRIWLKAADYCRPEAKLFPDGTQWMMALYQINKDVPGGFNPHTPNISYGRLGDYRLSSCGGYWLKLEGNRVTGNLVNAPRWEREPKMTPVLLDLVTQFVQGNLNKGALLEASQEDPALRELMLNTRSFLRNEN